MAINQSISRFYAVKGGKKEKIKINRQRTRRLDRWDGNGLQRKVGDRSSGPERTSRRRNHIVCVLVGIQENPAWPALRRAGRERRRREQATDGRNPNCWKIEI
jgi:hypothetical protein